MGSRLLSVEEGLILVLCILQVHVSSRTQYVTEPQW